MNRLTWRALIAVILLAAVFWGMDTPGPFQSTLRSALYYTARTDYHVEEWLEQRVQQWAAAGGSEVMGGMRTPCSIKSVSRHFGWYYHPETGKQVFHPGIVCRIDNQVPVYPVMSGKVASVSRVEDRYQVIIQHGNGLLSTTRGLDTVRVVKGQAVQPAIGLGTASEMIYLELQGKQGPINIEKALGIVKR
ncbi:MAG: peptidoglycan DD-metalloendopeptidase family protein [Solirubrobacterales bacterium]